MPSKVKSKECLEKYSLLAFPYHIGVSAECLSMVRFECCEPLWDLLPLGGLGGPPKVAFGVALPIGMLSMGSGKGCCLLGLGDCLGASGGWNGSG